MQALDREEFARYGADMFLVGGVHAIAPLARLLIQIVPTGKPTTREKVVFDKGKRPLDPCRAVRVPALMRHKTESKTLGECLHFRYRNHFPSRAAQHHDMRVADHHPLDHPAPLAYPIAQNPLAGDSLQSAD